MSDILVSKDKLRTQMKKDLIGKNIKLVDFSAPVLSGKFGRMSQEDRFSSVARATMGGNLKDITYSGKFSSGFDAPMSWSDGKVEMSVRDRIEDGFFMSSNTLPVDWNNLWDALRIDVTVNKEATPTIRQFFYDVQTNPAYTRTLNPTEINPFGVVFEENNGHGQAIPMGETRGGGYESITMVIYAAGFTWDLMGELFDQTITPERVMSMIMVGYNAKKDDIAMSPILNFSYSGDQQTAANTTSGVGRQELLYLTLEDAIDDLGDRDHPVTGRKLSVSNLVCLASAYDAKHIARVSKGLQNTNEEKYPGLSEITSVVEYEGEVIELRDRTITYDGVTTGTAYLAIPAGSSNNKYMKIAIKADLTVEVDLQPDVKNLSREERAYWFCEAIWYEGIQYFIQEITLPAW